MIYVKRQPDSTTQKVTSIFVKRVKKSNLVQRVRKTQNWIKDKMKSKLFRRRRAIRIALYATKAELLERMGKKMSK